MTDRPLGVQISRMLKDRGVDVIFGIPGVHNQELYRGIEEAEITHVLARHEQGAGFMADGYARASGRPGVAYVITGPGLTNIMTPMGQGYSDSVPMLVISSCLGDVSARQGQLHQMKDQRGAADTVSDWSVEARSAAATYNLIDRALLEFKTSRPRPKHIQVPIGVLEKTASAAPAKIAALGDQTRPEMGLVARVHEKLLKARRPLIVFGGGVVSTSQPLGQTWLENLQSIPALAQAASFTTYAGRGTISREHGLHFGSHLARPASRDIIAQSDLVLAVGTELAEVDIWRERFGHAGDLIRVDLDTLPLADTQYADLQIACDATAFLQALFEMLSERPAVDSDWTTDQVSAFRARARAEVASEYPNIMPVADALRACLPKGTMIYSDMTQFAYAANEVWDMDNPGHWHHPSGFGTLGYALPAAIGGSVARPGQPTLAIAGDYGFQYTVQELATAVELGLPLPIFLWDNGKLGAIESSMIGAQIQPNAVIARNPDFLKLADAYGANAAAPQSLDEMCQAVQKAFTASGPTLIRVTPDTARG